MTVLVLVEIDGARPTDLSLEALTLGRGVAQRLGAELAAVVVHPQADPVQGAVDAIGPALAGFAVRRVHLASHPELVPYAPRAWAATVAGLLPEQLPAAVVGPGSDRGQEVLAHLAARIGQPFAANCVAVLDGPGSPAAGGWLVRRHRWGGSLLEQARLAGDPKLLTVAAHTVAAELAAEPARVEVVPFVPELAPDDLRVRVARRVESAAGAVSLADAPVVVGGGRGVGSAEAFAELEELARLLGGTVGVSRAVTSLGWRPHSDQVGQTGTRIAPELYIACGISGAIQHMVGAKGAKHILAINTDPEAPIMAHAEWAVIGDVHAVVPALVTQLRVDAGGSGNAGG